jgi:hypothetical protein
MWLLESGGEVSVSECGVVTRLGINTAVDHLYVVYQLTLGKCLTFLFSSADLA